MVLSSSLIAATPVAPCATAIKHLPSRKRKSASTWLLKTVFADSVNKQADGLFTTLAVNPSAPYWYLYALFFIFLVTPTFSSVKVAVCNSEHCSIYGGN